jgi:hypothetical protein
MGVVMDTWWARGRSWQMGFCWVGVHWQGCGSCSRWRRCALGGLLSGGGVGIGVGITSCGQMRVDVLQEFLIPSSYAIAYNLGESLSLLICKTIGDSEGKEVGVPCFILNAWFVLTACTRESARHAVWTRGSTGCRNVHGGMAKGVAESSNLWAVFPLVHLGGPWVFSEVSRQAMAAVVGSLMMCRTFIPASFFA